jgi:hypothetical protein
LPCGSGGADGAAEHARRIFLLLRRP